MRPASAVMCGRLSPSLPCVTLVSSSLCMGYFKDMRDFQGFLLPWNNSRKAIDEERKSRGCGILPPWSRSQNANLTCSPFSLVSLPCTSQCTGSPSWSPHLYSARQCGNDDLQKQTPKCLWSGGQPALEEMVLGQVQDAA